MPGEDGPISPMKKLKILSEHSPNVKKTIETPSLQTIKEANVPANVEPLLEESSSQYVIFPINHEDMWSMYKHFVDNFWSATETIQQLDTSTLSYDENQFMKYFTSIFSSPENQGLANDSFAEDFCKIIQITEAKFFYGHQLFVQNIHYEMYNKLLDKFIEKKEEKEKMLKIVENFDAVKNKRQWLSQWKTASFGDQIMVSACLHGLMFSSLDLVCEWLKNKTRSPFTHELLENFERMIVDEELQRDFACLMISHLKAKPSKEKMLSTINLAAKLEFDFLINGLKTDLIEINPEEIIQLIDRKTKSLKLKMFGSFDDKKKSTADMENKKATTNNQENNSLKENHHQKLVLDDDF